MKQWEHVISHLPMLWAGALLLLLDTGSFEHACPRSFRPDLPLLPIDEALPARAANGAPMRVYGRKRVVFYLFDDRSMTIDFVVMDVQRPLLSVGKLVEKGCLLQLGPQSSLRYRGQATPDVRQSNLYYLPVQRENAKMSDILVIQLQRKLDEINAIG
eukprot:16209232-Heterocapsa_arctica.AAC.1